MLLIYVKDLISFITILESIEAKRSNIFSCITSLDLKKKNMGNSNKEIRTLMEIFKISFVESEESIEASMI
jgi:hypothetical protein